MSHEDDNQGIPTWRDEVNDELADLRVKLAELRERLDGVVARLDQQAKNWTEGQRDAK